MIRFYFFLNAVFYVIFALWCTVKHGQTSASAGYVELNHSGHSEYLVVYGGLQLGLAIFYAYLGANPALYRIGVIFSVMLYGPIVAYRLVTVVRYWPVGSLTLGTGVLEAFMLMWGILAVMKT